MAAAVAEAVMTPVPTDGATLEYDTAVIEAEVLVELAVDDEELADDPSSSVRMRVIVTSGFATLALRARFALLCGVSAVGEELECSPVVVASPACGRTGVSEAYQSFAFK